MMRRPVMTRKGAKPALVISIGRGDHGAPPEENAADDEGPDDASAEGETSDVGACPECGCTFNYDTGKVMDHGLLKGGHGPDLEESGGPHMPMQPSGQNPSVQTSGAA